MSVEKPVLQGRKNIGPARDIMSVEKTIKKPVLLLRNKNNVCRKTPSPRDGMFETQHSGPEKTNISSQSGRGFRHVQFLQILMSDGTVTCRQRSNI